MTPQEIWNAVPPRSLIQLMDSDGLNTVYKDDDNLGKYLRLSSDTEWIISRRDGGRIATVWPWERDFRSQDFVVIARDVDPCTSDDEIKRLAAGGGSPHVAAMRIGDIVDWPSVPDGTVVRATRPGDGWLCVRRGDAGVWLRSPDGKWGTELGLRPEWMHLKEGRGDQAEIVMFDAPLDIDAIKLRVEGPRVGTLIPWRATPDGALVKDEERYVALRRGDKGKWWRGPNEHWSDSLSGIHNWNDNRWRKPDDMVTIVALGVPANAERNADTMRNWFDTQT